MLALVLLSYIITCEQGIPLLSCWLLCTDHPYCLQILVSRHFALQSANFCSWSPIFSKKISPIKLQSCRFRTFFIKKLIHVLFPLKNQSNMNEFDWNFHWRRFQICSFLGCSWNCNFFPTFCANHGFMEVVWNFRFAFFCHFEPVTFRRLHIFRFLKKIVTFLKFPPLYSKYGFLSWISSCSNRRFKKSEREILGPFLQNSHFFENSCWWLVWLHAIYQNSWFFS